jgi:carbon monoxide dehydrogenase subunit G
VRLDNEFVVPRPVHEAWAVLTDIERIAPCMPGAKLTKVDGDDYHGTVKVKVGPVVAQYAGVARFRERDDERHHAVLEATGKQSGGAGRASAVVTADLAAEGDSTRVTVVTDLTIAGPLAQFGRGAIAQVSGKLLDQFVSQLRERVLADAPAAGGPASAGPAASPASAGSPAPAASSAPAASDASSPRPVASASGGSASGPVPSASDTSAARPVPSTSDTSAPRPAPSTSDTSASGPAPGHESGADDIPAAAEPAPVDLLRAAAAPVLIRLIPAILVVAVLIVLIVWLA